MKCKNCGGEIRLEDMYCPYCGRPNEEAHRHAADMEHYRRDYQNTKQDVIERAGAQSRRAMRFAAIALLIVAIGANIILQMNSFSLIRALEDSRIKKNIPAYTAKMDKYLEEEDYLGFASFCYNKSLSVYDDPFKEYYIIYRVASNYRNAVMELMQLVNHSRYSDIEHLAKYTSQYVQTFYEDLEPEKYTYYENYDTPFVQEHIEKMTEAMDSLCEAYLSMTPEEAKSLRNISTGSRLLLIEKGLEPYMAEQAGESQTSD